MMRFGARIVLNEDLLLNGGMTKIPRGALGRITRQARESGNKADGMLWGVTFDKGPEVWCAQFSLREAS